MRAHAPNAKDYTQKKGCRHRALTDVERSRNSTKSRVRAKVEHPFLILKRVYGFSKARYRGLAKNATRLFIACGLGNVYMDRQFLLRPTYRKYVEAMRLNRSGYQSQQIRGHVTSFLNV